MWIKILYVCMSMDSIELIQILNDLITEDIFWKQIFTNRSVQLT